MAGKQAAFEEKPPSQPGLLLKGGVTLPSPKSLSYNHTHTMDSVLENFFGGGQSTCAREASPTIGRPKARGQPLFLALPCLGPTPGQPALLPSPPKPCASPGSPPARLGGACKALQPQGGRSLVLLVGRTGHKGEAGEASFPPRQKLRLPLSPAGCLKGQAKPPHPCPCRALRCMGDTCHSPKSGHCLFSHPSPLMGAPSPFSGSAPYSQSLQVGCVCTTQVIYPPNPLQ